MAAPQYAFRSQKLTGIVDGPSWALSSKIPADATSTRTFAYSPNGDWIAYAHGETVQLLSSEGSATPISIAQPAVVALKFSPKSSWLFTFERPVKSDTDVHKNVKAWDVATGAQVGGWYQKTFDDWEPIITQDEAHLLRPTSSDILVYTPPMAARPASRLKGDGVIKGLFLSSPAELPEGCNSARSVRPYNEPAVAVWVGERKGAPASVALYPLGSIIGKPKAVANGDSEPATENRNMPMTVARKAFYKADKLQVKWNNAGTMALFLTHTDVDNSGKSYYGETNLYLVALDGSFDSMVDLDKEGPIYDFGWNPTSREFTVCYGYMPARTTTYDHKAKPVHQWGSNHRNFVLYQPQGRLFVSAGFGNLAGGIDIWEVSTRKKIAEFTASNSSYCEWSACGRYILTGTLSPRLRVDNGVKIWWCNGQLLHVHPEDDLYQVSFRPTTIAKLESFPSVVPKAPAANASVSAISGGKGATDATPGAPARPVGAYRPPGARGSAASDAYKREDDTPPSSGASTPMFRGGKPSARYIPGASIPGAATPGAANNDKKKRVRTKNKKGGEGANNGEATSPGTPAVAPAPVADDPEAIAKKVRNLTKKLKAILELKERVAKGEVLEKTQLQKIDTEDSVRGEIKALGAEP